MEEGYFSPESIQGQCEIEVVPIISEIRLAVGPVLGLVVVRIMIACLNYIITVIGVGC